MHSIPRSLTEQAWETTMMATPPPTTEEDHLAGFAKDHLISGDDDVASAPMMNMILPQEQALPISKKRKQVSFGNVEFREHPVILGDHPSARWGIPITIDWSYREIGSMSVVEFDNMRRFYPHRTTSSMKQREKMWRLRMSPYYKRKLLRELQYSGQEIKEREQEMLKIQRQRKTTKRVANISKSIRKAQEKLQRAFAKINFLANKKTVPVMMDNQ
uniref:Uncharacterized protein n=1 Tax=Grammatophora oceanica TaxID=210454 RepID=A0A7S1UPT8_9STRA|mmetsp:Transcript_12396/g.18208  ORF Transcript_12396/g.18208 Transcript_12396/m.18208 type:complete len:216 (+) Transcript_12396:175-822(+)